MNTIKTITFILLVLTLMNCVPSPATEREIREKMDSVHFDLNVVKNINQYENLKTFLESHLDTIIKFRYSKNVVTLIREPVLPDSSYLEDDKCYTFFQENERYDITNVPKHLVKELDSLFHSFDKKDISSFRVCKDSSITIITQHKSSDENGLAINHSLIWNTESGRDYRYSMNKDTSIHENCIYRIGLFEDYGY